MFPTPRPLLIAALIGCSFFTFGVGATELQAGKLPALPRMPVAEATRCISPAAQYHSVNPWVLRAILSVESNFNEHAVNVNANKTIDVGMAQINSTHFKELQGYGIAPANLLDSCVASYVAAWHLARQMRQYGNTWYGIASYHSASPCQNSRYAGLLWNRLVGWGVLPGPGVLVKTLAQCGYKAPRASAQDARPTQALAFDGE